MSGFDRSLFFSSIRDSVFGGSMTQGQVSGIERLLEEANRIGLSHAPQLAYILATSCWETGRKMQPVEEIGRGRGREYGKPHPKMGHIYFGRGDVQLTWYENYVTMEKLLGVPLSTKPELALDPKISAMILFEGMLRGKSNRGDFTGKSLEDYVNERSIDFVKARRVVNGTDRAQEIADIATNFLDALWDAGAAIELPWKDDAVRSLQASLNLLGYSMPVDGAFGVKTTSAVKDFQAKNGLLPDGVAGPATMEALQNAIERIEKELDPPPSPAEVPDLVTGGGLEEQVKDLRARLERVESVLGLRG